MKVHPWIAAHGNHAAVNPYSNSGDREMDAPVESMRSTLNYLGFGQWRMEVVEDMIVGYW
jgi:hypothetical protein